MNFRNVSPLAWMLGASAAANVITMLGMLYIVFSGIYVRDGYVDVSGAVKIRNEPIQVQVTRMP